MPVTYSGISQNIHTGYVCDVTIAGISFNYLDVEYRNKYDRIVFKSDFSSIFIRCYAHSFLFLRSTITLY